MRIKSLCLLPSLITALTGVIIVASGLGYYQISLLDVITICAAHLGLPVSLEHIDETAKLVISDVRLPRILCAVIVGGSLAAAGTVFQAVLLNPLADPYTLGVSSGAAFGAALSIILTLSGFVLPTHYTVMLSAFAGALATLWLVFTLAGSDKSFSSNTLILSGVIVAAILSAGIGFLKYLADEQVNVIIFWLMGSFVGKQWSEIYLLLIITVPCLVLLMLYSRDMNILSFGGKAADSLGINAVKTRKTLLVTASLLTAASVSVAGVIGFVGLIMPHLFRRIIGPDNRVLLPASFLGGCLLLLIADTFTRAILPNEIPIGIITSLIGGPFFCYIFVTSKRRMW